MDEEDNIENKVAEPEEEAHICSDENIFLQAVSTTGEYVEPHPVIRSIFLPPYRYLKTHMIDKLLRACSSIWSASSPLYQHCQHKSRPAQPLYFADVILEQKVSCLMT